MAYSSDIASHISIVLPFVALAALCVTLWASRSVKVAFICLSVSLVAGQAIRIPLPGQAGGVLLSDVAVLCVFAATAVYAYTHRVSTDARVETYIASGITVFAMWGIFLALVQSGGDIVRIGIALSYAARTWAYLMLLPLFLYLFRNTAIRIYAHMVVVGIAVALAVAGGVQLVFAPDLTNIPFLGDTLVRQGWDPHQGRMVASWLDPNFLGMAFVLLLAYIGASTVRARGKARVWYGILCAALIASLVLTRSRSSMAAAIVSLVLLSPGLLLMYMRRNVLVRVAHVGGAVLIAVFVVVFSWAWLGERAVGLFAYDPTVELRLQSLAAVWSDLAVPHTVVGGGYNAYQFIAQDFGLIEDTSIHSRAGADSSMLTLWVTTGVVGVLLFALPWLWAGLTLLHRWIVSGSVYGYAGVYALLALTIHSQFVNSWLYGHLIILIALIVALAYRSKEYA